MDFLFDSHAEVAVFLDRRFPTAQDRAALARLTGLRGTHADWLQILEEAASQGRLARLVRAAADLRPDDANLLAMAEWCEQQHRSAQVALVRTWAPRGLLAAGVAAAALALSWSVNPAPQGVAAEDALAQASHAAPAAEVSDEAPEVLAAEPSSAVASAPSLPTGTGSFAASETPVAPPPSAAAPPTAQVAVVDPDRPRGRCRSSDRIVGYWYAGRSAPGAQGEVLTMDYAVRVRLDYPDAHNQFNARAPVTCHLVPGDRVRLTDAPIHVPGDAYWVPLTDGDLLAPEEALADEDTGSSQ